MLKAALIGLGSMGKNHFRALKRLPNVQIEALCDNQLDEFEGQNVWRSADEMLANTRLDAALIVVPTFLHREIALKCAQYGLDMFIEKPAAATAGEALEIAAMAESKKIKSAVGHIERFNPVVMALKKELEGKDIYSLVITRVGPIPPRIADVGILTDLAVHDVDLIRFLTGKEVADRHIVSSKKIHNHYEDNAILSFKLQNEVVATISTNWLTPFRKRRIEVATAAGYYEADLISQSLCCFSAYTASQSYLVRDIAVQKGEPLLNELGAFINYCATGERGFLASIEDSIKTLELVRAA
ncbi:MAG: Gfo/Idh/MocA family oxidoreductase [Helicobacteraceae bacterium]|jgi:predicted dehydrogenase|nr:Gfo/Idh/MocA family oxidoreductase [Helicobacteraceae bacterium]